MAEQAVTQTGADGRSSRAEIMNIIEGNRVAEVNAELEANGSDVRLEHEPTPEIKRASGKDATDEELIVDDEDDPDKGKTTVDDATKTDDKTVVAADGKKDDEKETIYDFLGEDKLPTTKVKIKVDGVEQEIPVADLVRGHQINAAADKRLEQASIAKKKADQIVADATTEAERIVAGARETAAKTDSKADEGDGKDKTGQLSGKDAISSAMKLIYDGNQEEAAGLLDAEINRRVKDARSSDATVDPDALAAKIRTDLSWDAALSQFNTDHPEITSDPDLAEIFQKRLNAAGSAASTPKEAIEKALEAMPSWVSKVSEKTPVDDKDGKKTDLKVNDEALRKRNEEKAGREAVRSNSSIRSQAQGGAEETYDPAKVVAEMRAARGQA